jgi:hypothetical protein
VDAGGLTLGFSVRRATIATYDIAGRTKFSLDGGMKLR